jgi:hypothetical protein
MDCGYSACADALDLHHRDPRTKEFALGSFNGSLDRLLREAEKCDVVCANCHAIRHDWEAMPASARQVELRRETKARAVALFGGVCQGCGESYPRAVFQFHHLDPDKKEFAISTDGVNRPWAATVAELVKCAMLCANCHREVHAGIRILDPSSVGPQSLEAAEALVA